MFRSDLSYLADVNAGIIGMMQSVDPDAVWYVDRKKQMFITEFM